MTEASTADSEDLTTTSNALASLARARTELANARNLDDVLHIRDLAKAAEVYLRAAQQAGDAANDAAEIRILAEHKAGGILRDMKDTKQRAGSGGDYTNGASSLNVTKLQDLGVSRMQSSRWQKLSDIDPMIIDAYTRSARANGEEVTTTGLLHALHDAEITLYREHFPRPTLQLSEEPEERITGHLSLRPLNLQEANQLVSSWHRHHEPVVAGHRFSIGACRNEQLVGAVIVGYPVARNTDPIWIAEVTRLVSNGSSNVCSFLYAAAARAAKAMGFRSIQTFILDSEPGTSLQAAGWILVNKSTGGSWNNNSRYRPPTLNVQPKQKWAKDLT
jgi:hypothetical protein